ncbi:MAG: ribonuclease HI [Oscillospiraceae bacterium]|nr:ribonuclease HI [Oscillospiraceae bacterium]
MKDVSIYTDGACKGNPGPGGWSAVLVCENREKRLCGGEKETTNNRMELTAVIKGLEAIIKPCRITVYSDSKYVVDSIQKGWARSWKSRGWKKADKSPALNIDLFDRLLEYLDKYEVNFVWVKGHAGNRYNELCDQMAVEAAEEMVY